MPYKYKAIKINGRKVDEHRFLMQSEFGGSLPSGMVVHHKNGDFRDNRIENLEIMSAGEHSRIHGQSEKSNFAKLKEAEIPDIRKRIYGGEKDGQIAQDFNVHPHTIRDIRIKRTWKFIP